MRLLILDRDGVINEDSDAFIKSPEEWIPIPGSLEAVAAANQKGYRVVVISNQSGLARGLFDIATLNRIHAKMLREVARFGGRIEAIYFCPHGPNDACSCRKPLPGMLTDLARRLDTDLGSAILIGDRETDLAAGAAVGATPVLVRTGHGEQTLSKLHHTPEVRVYDNLAAAVAGLERAA